MRSFCLFILFICCVRSSSLVAQNTTVITRYIKVPAGYLMVLQPGDSIFAQLQLLARQENIPSANFSGLGFAEVTFGFFNSRTKRYKSKHFKAGELAAMQGSIAWQKGEPSIHAHGSITNRCFKAKGGHMLWAVVGKGTLEILVVVHDKKLDRIKDEKLGANVICLEGCEK